MRRLGLRTTLASNDSFFEKQHTQPSELFRPTPIGLCYSLRIAAMLEVRCSCHNGDAQSPLTERTISRGLGEEAD